MWNLVHTISPEVESFTGTSKEQDVKVKPSVKKICDKCKVIRRNGRVMVRSHQIFDAKLISSATKEFATAKGYLFAVSAHIPMHVPVRDHALQLLVRRRRPSNGRP
mgnify:CR=1 FL=1